MGTEQASAMDEFGGTARLDQASADGVATDLMDLVGAISGMRRMAQAGAASATDPAVSCSELDAMLSLLEGKARAALDDFEMGAQG